MNDFQEFRQLWTTEEQGAEDTMTLQQLTEKQSSFRELVRAENEAEYLVGTVLGAMLSLAAWHARYEPVRIGFAILAAAVILLAMVTWMAHRDRVRADDRSVQEHLRILIGSYSDRIRFLTTYTIAVGVPLSLGVLFVVLGVPGALTQMRAWSLALLLIGLFWTGAMLRLKARRAQIAEKRSHAERLLQDLVKE